VGAKVSGDPLLRNPITGITACWASDVSGQEAPKPTTSFMKSRRFIHTPMLKTHRINPYKCCGRAKQNEGHVRFGSKADMCSARRHVRFTPNSDRESGLPQTVMSASPPKADMCGAARDVRFGPIADTWSAASYLYGNFADEALDAPIKARFSRMRGNYLFDNPAAETLAGWLFHFRAVCLLPKQV
jgi:hypothetical protein